MSWGLGRREKKKKDCPPVQFCAQSVQSGLLESRMAQGLGSEAQRRLFEQIGRRCRWWMQPSGKSFGWWGILSWNAPTGRRRRS